MKPVPRSKRFSAIWSTNLFATILVSCLAYGWVAQVSFAQKPAQAQQFDYGSVRLLQTGEKSGALLFDLNSPWKISWRKNTINVFPTELRWQANASSFLWPFPKIFDLFDTRSYGYEGRTALPFTTRAPIQQGERQGEHIALRFAACAQVCLPIETTLKVEQASEQEQILIAAALQQVPQQKSMQEGTQESMQEGTQESMQESMQKGLHLTYLPVDSPDRTLATQEGQEEGQSVLLQGRLSQQQTQNNMQSLRNPRLIVERADTEQGGLFEVTSLKVSRNLRFKAEGRLPRDAQQPVMRVSLSADNMLPIALLTTPQLAPSPYDASQQLISFLPSSASLLGLLALAFLGGLILNAMPCVFPVFAIKIAALARAHAQDRNTANRTGTSKTAHRLQTALLANALGVMLAFLLLASVLVLAKSGGEKLGWGFQFHWPVFSGSLAALLLLLACDGWRIVALPFPAYREKVRPKEGGATSSRSVLSRRKEWSSECATGMLLTWLATPCAAPILGSALSAAIVQRAPVVFLMFAFMGAGMAAPLLLAALYPHRVAKIFPSPGAWSESLRKVLAIAIFAASLWLFSIFAKQLSLTAAIVLAVATLLVVLALRKRQRAKHQPQPRTLASARLALLLVSPVLVAVLLNLLPSEGLLQRQPTSLPSQDATSLAWQAFAPERIDDFLADENLVVVNVTADWCLSCKVNEQRVYKAAAVHERLEQLRPFVLMLADWTSHDARIASFMREHQRYAIPFTAIFIPDGEVLLLPELYGKQTFLDALAYADTLRYRQAHAKVSKP